MEKEKKNNKLKSEEKKEKRETMDKWKKEKEQREKGKKIKEKKNIRGAFVLVSPLMTDTIESITLCAPSLSQMCCATMGITLFSLGVIF